MPHYTAFGLAIFSEVPLDHLEEVAETQPHIIIFVGGVPDMVPDVISHGEDKEKKWWTSDDTVLVGVDGVAAYAIHKGREIRVDAAEDAPDSDIQLFLLNTCMGVCLGQRGVPCIHATAYVDGDEAVVTVGSGKSGKSVTAAKRNNEGFRVLGDDLLALGWDAKGPVVYPSYPWVYLWPDGAKHAEMDMMYSLGTVREGLDKHIFPLDGWRPDPASLGPVWYRGSATRCMDEDTLYHHIFRKNLLTDSQRALLLDSCITIEQHLARRA